MAECRVKAFMKFLRYDLHELSGLTVLLVNRPYIKTPSFAYYLDFFAISIVPINPILHGLLEIR